MSAFTDLSNNKIGDSIGDSYFFHSLYFFLALIAWFLFFESLRDPS
jgi:hypothetical protein